MNITDALLVLELSTPISKAGLKKAYRDALLVWHPDRFTENNDLRNKAEAKTYLINEAYALLSRIPESDHPYRLQAKQSPQKPVREPNFPSAPSPQKKPQAPAPSSSPREPAPAANHPQQQTKAKNKQTTAIANKIYTIAACVVVSGSALFLYWFFYQQLPRKSPNQSNTADDPSQKFESLRMKAESGDLDAQKDLGLAYERGVGVVKDEAASLN